MVPARFRYTKCGMWDLKGHEETSSISSNSKSSIQANQRTSQLSPKIQSEVSRQISGQANQVLKHSTSQKYCESSFKWINEGSFVLESDYLPPPSQKTEASPQAFTHKPVILAQPNVSWGVQGLQLVLAKVIAWWSFCYFGNTIETCSPYSRTQGNNTKKSSNIYKDRVFLQPHL